MRGIQKNTKSIGSESNIEEVKEEDGKVEVIKRENTEDSVENLSKKENSSCCDTPKTSLSVMNDRISELENQKKNQEEEQNNIYFSEKRDSVSCNNSNVEGTIRQYIKEGLTDKAISLRCKISIEEVVSERKHMSSVVENMRDILKRHIDDFDEAFDIAKYNYQENPDSKIHYSAMNAFATSLKDLMTQYNDLEDPSKNAIDVINKILKPMLITIMNDSISMLNRYKSDLCLILPKHLINQAEINVKSQVKVFSGNITRDFNKAIDTLSVLYNIDLSKEKITSQNL